MAQAKLQACCAFFITIILTMWTLAVGTPAGKASLDTAVYCSKLFSYYRNSYMSLITVHTRAVLFCFLFFFLQLHTTCKAHPQISPPRSHNHHVKKQTRARTHIHPRTHTRQPPQCSRDPEQSSKPPLTRASRSFRQSVIARRVLTARSGSGMCRT